VPPGLADGHGGQPGQPAVVERDAKKAPTRSGRSRPVVSARPSELILTLVVVRVRVHGRMAAPVAASRCHRACEGPTLEGLTAARDRRMLRSPGTRTRATRENPAR
jgi:hypothetical protein